MVGLSEIKANSAQLGWGLAELGNISEMVNHEVEEVANISLYKRKSVVVAIGQYSEDGLATTLS